MADVGYIRAALRTDQGRVRQRNEDFAACWEPAGPDDAVRHGWLYIVADGVGGADAGDVASQFATERAIHHYLADEKTADWGARLQAALQAANADLRQLVAGRGDGARMATTMCAAVAATNGDGARLTIANVGDSRAYHWRDGRLEQVTRDQSLVAQLLEEGAISADEAAYHPHRNVILYSLGSERAPKIDLYSVDLAPGDRILLCTDGLTRYLPPEELADELAGEQAPGTITARLIDLANERGGADNVAVVLLQAEAGGPDWAMVEEDTIRTRPVALGDERDATVAVAPAWSRTALWTYTAVLCLLETILIVAIWYRLAP